ncbi:spore germination protein [Salinibacillus kushneri]|uniref:Spore germination protein n=1 Tax=Salinibacillus kushneri TaxID=237682 RepID=A0A1I0C402_9BACI|nr:spore germination protein [Salinibacillus kushneri]SET13853.1 spore germination protein [Salinibacillus kushneri]
MFSFEKSEVERVKPVLEKQFKGTEDAQFRTLSLENDQEIELVYIQTVIDNANIHEQFFKPFFEINDIQRYESYIKSLPNFKEFKDEQDTVKEILHGSIVFLIQNKVYMVGFIHQENSAVLDASVETTILGPQKALSENIYTNLNLIRHRYHEKSLKVEKLPEIGDKSNIQVCLLYDEKEADSEIVDKVKKRVKKADRPIVQSAGELHRALTNRKRRLFPTLLVTERPDRIAYNLYQGKVIIMIEGIPFVLIGPTVFYDFMSSMEDFYQPYWVSKFLIVLRYIGLFISLFLPSAYVGIISYNPEVLRIQLAFSIAGSRMPVPYPSYLEVLFMLIMMEMLTEASIRLPKTIGPTATTVGGLILGQAATDAGLVSNIMIIIVAAVAISNFIIPINEMSFAMRVMKYLLLIITTFSGLIGLVIGTVGLIYYLVYLDSFGKPYLKLFTSHQK